MTKTIKLAVFTAVALAQLAIPAWMIGQREWTLRHGAVYKFRTAPIDPYDAFRGRYVWLNFEEQTATWTGPGPVPGEWMDRNRTICAALTTGPDGFAQFTSAALSPPASGDYLHVRVAYYWDEASPSADATRVRIVLPFDRFYMNEAKAPAAEEAYREHSNTRTHDAYVSVRVWRGHAVIEQVYLGGQPIEDVIAQGNAQ